MGLWLGATSVPCEDIINLIPVNTTGDQDLSSVLFSDEVAYTS